MSGPVDDGLDPARGILLGCALGAAVWGLVIAALTGRLLDVAVFLGGLVLAYGLATAFGTFHGWLTVISRQHDGGPDRSRDRRRNPTNQEGDPMRNDTQSHDEAGAARAASALDVGTVDLDGPGPDDYLEALPCDEPGCEYGEIETADGDERPCPTCNGTGIL